MLGTKPLYNKPFYPKPLRGTMQSIAYHFRGWHSPGSPRGGDLERAWSCSIWPAARHGVVWQDGQGWGRFESNLHLRHNAGCPNSKIIPYCDWQMIAGVMEEQEEMSGIQFEDANTAHSLKCHTQNYTVFTTICLFQLLSEIWEQKPFAHFVFVLILHFQWTCNV